VNADDQGPVSEREEIRGIDMILRRNASKVPLLKGGSLHQGRENGGTIVVSDDAIVETDTMTGISLRRTEMSAIEKGDMTSIAARGDE